ncbi:hypothetical protein LCGC14_1453330 [marine sediment metagenome]|uniref:Uncharacterized protein n=1 Tax=marine sediment metagenome TaxID=412755 RepID=A0A0F9LXT0_9ZZZZ
MKISVAPGHVGKGCDECLQKTIPLFTIQTLTSKLVLCETCAKEAVNAVAELAIKAQQLNLTHR